MKKYVWIVICFFILLYIGPSLIAPVTQHECAEAAKATALFEQGGLAVESLDRMLSGAALHYCGNNAFGLRIGNILVVALMSIFAMFAIKKCTSDAMTGIISALIFFTSFWSFYSPVVPNNQVWGEFFNVLALGCFFMASRESMFSIQRISLLILCGLLTVMSLLMNGISPFIMSFCIAVIFLLVERKYLDMLLVPVVISVITVGFLLLYGHYIRGGWNYELVVLANDFCADWKKMEESFSVARLFTNSKVLLIGVVPSLVFLICAIAGYKGYWKHFFRQSIYRFALIFLLVGIVSVLLNVTLFLAGLPLTILPYSFLVGAGFVNYMRTRNHFWLLYFLFIIFAFCIIGASLWYYCMPQVSLPRNFAFAGFLWGAFIFIGFLSPKTSARMKAYFIGLSVGLFAAMTAARYKEISSYELETVFAIAVEPASQTYEIYATPAMYHVVNFYMNDKNVKLAEVDENNALNELSDEMEKAAEKKEIVIFAKRGELSPVLLKRAKTLVHEKFTLHLFAVKK